MDSRSYVVVGCGHFGRRAVATLRKKEPCSEIIAIDKNRAAINKIVHLPIRTVVGHGVAYLSQYVLESHSKSYIIPTVPFHLAFEFILSQLKPLGARRRRVPSLPGVPHPMRGKKGDLYTSLADFICPEDCPEPCRTCIVTKAKRAKSLYKILMDLKGPFESQVLRSLQLDRGVGGFQFEELLNLVKHVRRWRTSHRLILISTASRCHGVISALSFS